MGIKTRKRIDDVASKQITRYDYPMLSFQTIFGRRHASDSLAVPREMGVA
jgi:hypothetical protein